MGEAPGGTTRPVQTTRPSAGAEPFDTGSTGSGLIVVRLLQYGMLFACSVLAARALGPAGRGEYVVPATLAHVVGVVTHLSLEGGLGRLLARRETTRAEAAALGTTGSLVVSALGVATYAILCIVLRPALPSSVSVASFVLAGAAIPFISSSFVFAVLLLRMGGIVAYGLTMAVGATAQLAVLIVLWLAAPLTPELVLAALLAASVLYAAGTIAGLARKVGVRALLPVRPGPLGRRSLGLSLRVHPAAVAIFTVTRLDLILVGILTDTAATGRYSVAKTVAEVGYLAAFGLALAALHGQTEAEEEGALRHTVEQTRLSLFIALVLAVLVGGGAYPLILVLYGDDWLAAVVPLILLNFGGIALAIELPVRGLLIRIAPLKHISSAALMALALSIVLDVALIPPLGITGAAIAAVVAYWGAAGGMLLLLRRQTGTPLLSVLRPPGAEALRGLVRRKAAPRDTGAGEPEAVPPLDPTGLP